MFFCSLYNVRCLSKLFLNLGSFCLCMLLPISLCFCVCVSVSVICSKLVCVSVAQVVSKTLTAPFALLCKDQLCFVLSCGDVETMSYEHNTKLLIHTARKQTHTNDDGVLHFFLLCLSLSINLTRKTIDAAHLQCTCVFV